MRTFIATDLDSSSIRLLSSDGESIKFQFEAEEVGDGYHTMHELYQHRMALNIALFKTWHEYIGKIMRSRKHADGSMFEGYFIVMAITPAGQISYHYLLKHWDKFDFLPEAERAPTWDGHSSLDVMERLMKL